MERQAVVRVAWGCGLALAGLGIGVWMAVGSPPRPLAAALLIGVVFAVAGMQLFSDRWGRNAFLIWGSSVGFLLTMSGAVWGFYVNSPLFHAVLRFNKAAMKAASDGWDDVVLLIVPGVAVVGAFVIAVEGLLAVLKRRREMRGRKKANSELYGKASFLGAALDARDDEATGCHAGQEPGRARCVSAGRVGDVVRAAQDGQGSEHCVELP